MGGSVDDQALAELEPVAQVVAEFCGGCHGFTRVWFFSMVRGCDRAGGEESL